MHNDGYIVARVDKELRDNAEDVLRRVGISTSEAIAIFLRQIILYKGLPFDLRISDQEMSVGSIESEAGEVEESGG